MEKVFIIGRNPSNDGVSIPVIANDPYNNVSANHCKITYDNGNFYIEDLNSSNGTFVDGNRINSKTKITKENTILLGSNYILNLDAPEFQNAIKQPIRLINTNTINKVVNVPLTGGIIGLLSELPASKLNKSIARENANGWKVVQIIPAASANIFIAILRIVLLIMTFLLYTTNDGYYISFEKQTN